MRLSERETRLRELMDDPACDPVRLRRTLERFALVNRAVSCWGAVYRARLRPLLRRLDRPARLLDIGCGGGDVVRRLVRLARSDGFGVEALGIDPDPRALEVARAAKTMPGVSYEQARSRALVERGERFDLVISNHLLHHLDDGSLEQLIADSEALATGLCLHSDIARSDGAYALFSVAVPPIAPGSFLLVDGLRSIRRSYAPAELRARLPPDWRVERPGRFRLLAVNRRR
ncbi:methyltransferase domain-containing protein [Leucobacter weissii]|uniref:Methyltransferase domain-containing protein n=1 Tax=Leucobacter weissii TaxID=1983706 RepID=A0A939MLP0_9MICO|nr:methyltransferase domain-containing protein [Leucobacter weissii]MBO1900922.1 methyltransferase domain-containing protein [Leucobacter weissii]